MSLIVTIVTHAMVKKSTTSKTLWTAEYRKGVSSGVLKGYSVAPEKEQCYLNRRVVFSPLTYSTCPTFLPIMKASDFGK